MKKSSLLWISAMLMIVIGMSGCSGDDEGNVVYVEEEKVHSRNRPYCVHSPRTEETSGIKYTVGTDPTVYSQKKFKSHSKIFAVLVF